MERRPTAELRVVGIGRDRSNAVSFWRQLVLEHGGARSTFNYVRVAAQAPEDAVTLDREAEGSKHCPAKTPQLLVDVFARCSCAPYGSMPTTTDHSACARP